MSPSRGGDAVFQLEGLYPPLEGCTNITASASPIDIIAITAVTLFRPEILKFKTCSVYITLHMHKLRD